jgi:predicted dinucleotide-binding enzyme
MQIGILGSGVVGKTLAAGYDRHGHTTRLASRESFAEVASWGDICVLAVNGAHAADVAEKLADTLAGKIVIDTTNPLDHSTGTPALSFGFDDSLGERVQRAAPAARVVKCYNTVGAPNMVDPHFGGVAPTMFIAGDDEGAKMQVAQLLEETGWESSDLGGIDASRYLEPMCIAWVRHGLRTGAWTHAFKVLS